MDVQLHGVSKSFAGTPALHPTTLSVAQGETVVLIGPSGCGKSTLLRLIIGLLTPDAGTVHLGGTRLTPANVLTLRQRIGYVIQEGGLFPHLTGRQNVALMARYLHWPAPRIQNRLDELLTLTQLPPDALDRHPGHLSGGQRQRLSLMRALFLDPDLLLLDEPLGALDPMIRAGLQQDLHHIFGKLKKTVVLVTHDLAEAAFFADRIVLLNEGHVVQKGPLPDFVQQPASPFVTRFIQAQRSLHTLTA